MGDWACESEGRVFLTGATGFLGAFFLALLAKSPQVKGIACLVRATDEVAGLSRVREVLSKYRIPFDFDAKVRIVPGDLTVPAFGLGQERYSRLAQESSVVFHLATFANYTLPYSSHRDTNICGFLNVLNFASTMRLKPLHYASTISACGVSGYLTGHNIPEDGRPGFDITNIKQHLGYTQSKMVAESIAWNVVSNGFPLTIHRPGFVSGHSVTGAYKMEDAINRLMASSIDMGVYPVPPSARNQFIPVDSVCTAMLRISLSNENLGHSFNIVRLNQDDTVSWRGVFELLGQCSSRPLRCVSPSEWIQRLAEKGGTGIRGGASIVTDKVRENMIWWGVGDQDMAVYETDNLRRALSGSPDLWEIPPVFKMLKTYYPLWAAQK